MLGGSALWYLSRATGVVTVVLFTVVFCLGVITAGRRRPQGHAATVVMGVHRWLSLGMLVFLAVHIVTAIIDGYVSIGWLAVVVPFISDYQPLLVGLGSLAVDLLIVVMVTSYLRHRIPERYWRGLHWLSYAMWVVALVHGFMMGTADQPGLRLTTLACGVLGGAAVVWRTIASHADRDRRELIKHPGVVMTDIAHLLETAGLTGRGGAAFSTAIKVRAAIENRARLIVNACDGELGAIKDAWVVEHHLDELLDGVRLVAGISRHTRFAAHRGSATAARLAAAGLPVLEAPARYVSSEETSLISLAHGGSARPMTKRTPFVYGGRDSEGRVVRPTVVLNAETLWRISQINRLGAEWFGSVGTEAEPGPRLVAVGGYVARPGVYESAAGMPLAELIALAGGIAADVRHIGVGGLGGILLTVAEARYAVWDTPGMKAYGGSMGPGIVTVWNPNDDPVETVTRMLEYAAGESAGQCGPCMFGLPALVQEWRTYLDVPSRPAQRRLTDRLDLLVGRGACAHPIGVSRFAHSALRALEPELTSRPHGRRYLEGAHRHG